MQVRHCNLARSPVQWIFAVLTLDSRSQNPRCSDLDRHRPLLLPSRLEMKLTQRPRLVLVTGPSSSLIMDCPTGLPAAAELPLTGGEGRLGNR